MKKPEHSTPVIIQVRRKYGHYHDQVNVVPVRGEKRKEMVTEMQITTNGSAKNYADHVKGTGVPNGPSADTLRQMKSQVVNKDMVSTDWIHNALPVIDTQKELIRGSVFNGYVRSFETADYFKMILQTEGK